MASRIMQSAMLVAIAFIMLSHEFRPGKKASGASGERVERELMATRRPNPATGIFAPTPRPATGTFAPPRARTTESIKPVRKIASWADLMGQICTMCHEHMLLIKLMCLAPEADVAPIWGLLHVCRRCLEGETVGQ